MKTHICENCNREHDGSYGSGRFCSKYCRCSYISKHVKHRHIPQVSIMNRSPYGTWRCKQCNTIFETRKQLEIHKHKIHPISKRSSWNKGLTKETSTIIANAAIKASTSLKGKRHLLSKQTREKLSEIRSKQLDTCKAGFQDVGWYKVKNLNGVEYTVRGHWEENVANKLTKDGILWIKNYSLKYFQNGIRRTYNPDFYLPLSNEFIEVKGYYSLKDKEKMKLVLEQNNVTIYFIDLYHYLNFLDGKIELSELIL